MPMYAAFLKLTPEANKDMKRSRERFEQGKKAVEAAGGKVHDAYYIVSQAEYLIITEFPSDQARVLSAINTLQKGNVQYEVHNVLPIEEYFKLTDSL